MKKLLIAAGVLALVAAPGPLLARSGGHGFGGYRGTASHARSDHYVSGYTRRDGTYVAPHYATNPNSTRNDNYSTRGNVNPYTGEPGTKPRDEDPHR